MENILIQKANYLADVLGYDVTIITTDQKNRGTFFDLSDKVKIVDLAINYCDGLSSKFWLLKKICLIRKHRKRLASRLISEKYDIVISLMAFDFTFLCKIKDGSRKILEYHFAKYSKVHATKNNLKKLIQKKRADNWNNIVSCYDKFIVLTEEDKRLWGNLNNIEVIPNFIKKLPGKSAELKNKRVLSVGRADYQKGFDMLIDAWEIVSKERPDWKLTIVGGGDKTYLENQIKNLNLTNTVELLPPNPKIEEEYLKSSIYVLSSRYEGLPLVLIEAMSYGLPIVAFGCQCGPKDILKASFSSIVECGNVVLLAQAILTWINSEEKRIEASKAALAEAGNYNIEQVMSQWDALFNSQNNEQG
ncbi:MAG: glycosyltransferase family 4 protein [Muribaculaceae bacterium]|nr:glycosyltransferase family 4 protein [Muribaculaceae bacterium]